jgi:hypothetical protein
MLVPLFAECRASLDVPEGMRTAALEMAATTAAADAIPESVGCVLDPHRYGDHVALLLDLAPEKNDGDVWIAWSADSTDVTVQIRSYCAAESPSKGDFCWLHEKHRGGHAWERHE